MRLSRDQINHVELSRTYHAFAFNPDGTLRLTLTPGHAYPHHDADWMLATNAHSILSTYYTPVSWHRFALITNQPGIAHNIVDVPTVRNLLGELNMQLFRSQAVVFICGHDESDECACRLPSPYRLLEFAHGHRIKRSKLLFIGSMLDDADAADRAGCDFAWSVDFFGW